MNERDSRVFLLDANVFIEAHRRYYGLDLCPGFWDCLEAYAREGRVLSVDRVRDEIEEGDALEEWVGNAPDDLFASTADPAVARVFGDMMNWVLENPQFKPEAKSDFARVADGWVIAYARVNGSTVVTHEVFDPNIRKRVPIPNVCREFEVPYVNTFTMLRALRVRFHWVR